METNSKKASAGRLGKGKTALQGKHKRKDDDGISARIEMIWKMNDEAIRCGIVVNSPNVDVVRINGGVWGIKAVKVA